MSVHDHPFPRREPPKKGEWLNVVGAPPWGIDWSPAGWADTRAYVTNVDNAADKLQAANAALAKEDVTKGQQPSDAELQWRSDWTIFYAKWKAFVATWQGDLGHTVGGMLPSEAWKQTELYEKDLAGFRQRFSELVVVDKKETPPPPDPGALEPKESPGPIDKLAGAAGAIPWTALLVVGGLIAGGLVLNTVMRHTP